MSNNYVRWYITGLFVLAALLTSVVLLAMNHAEQTGVRKYLSKPCDQFRQWEYDQKVVPAKCVTE